MEKVSLDVLIPYDLDDTSRRRSFPFRTARGHRRETAGDRWRNCRLLGLFFLVSQALFADVNRECQPADGEDVAGLTSLCSDTRLK